MNITRSIFSCCLVSALVFLCACSGSSKKIDLGDAQGEKENIALLSTDQYLPVVEKNKEGQVVPYEAELNPYTSKRARVKKESVASFIQARRALDAQDEAKAKQLLENLASSDKNLSGPWVMLGDMKVNQNDLEGAAADYTKAIEINKRNVNAYAKLAKVRRLQGRFALAQNTYAKALEVWPDFPEAHLNLGVLYDVYLNRSVEAQKHIEAYLFLNGGNDEQARAWLEEIKTRTGRDDRLNIDSPLLAEREN